MTHYLYIPGLGDRFDPLRRFALSRWQAPGVRVTLIPMHWSDKSETYEQKYIRIAKTLDTIKDETVILVGESAGGAMALLAFSRLSDRVHAVTTLCGYNHGANDIHPIRRRRNPAFYPLLLEVDNLLPRLSPQTRRSITTMYSTRDRTVTPSHSKIDGTTEIVLSTPGHFRSIARVLISGPKGLQ